MQRIVVTGATGFVGRHLINRLVRDGKDVTALVRTKGTAPKDVTEVAVGDFTEVDDWVSVLEEHDAVIHLAARVHVMNETAPDPKVEFRHHNVQVTQGIATGAAQAGIRNFIFLSSIKVNGEETDPGKPFTCFSLPNPLDPYGHSKAEAEVMLERVSETNDMSILVIRPPLVYGPGVGGNFLRLLRLASVGLPLPLGSTTNKRAMISVDNLVDRIIAGLEESSTPFEVSLVSDKEVMSTGEIVLTLADAMGTPARLFPFPTGLLTSVLSAAGKRQEAQRLLGSLEVEVGSTAGTNWRPPHSAKDEFRKVAEWYKGERSKK